MWTHCTWEWDGNVWRPRAATALLARDHGLAYDLRRRKVVAWIGSTWEYGPELPAEFESYGPGCAGSAGVPSLATSGLPWIDTSISLTLTSLPFGTVGVLLLGSSRVAWNGLGLPFDLAPFGAPGCVLRAAPDVTVAFGTGAGSASIPVGLSRSLLGYEAFLQLALADPPANAFGVTLSNAAVLRVGER